MSSSDEEVQWRHERSVVKRCTDSMYSSRCSNVDLRPPSYNSLNQTEVKKRLSTCHPGYACEPVARTDTKDLFSKCLTITDKASLQDALEVLKQQQEEIKRMQLVHEQHLNLILDSQPTVQQHLMAIHQKDTRDQTTEVQPPVPPLRPKMIREGYKVDMFGGLLEEKMYVQLEKLYVNARTFKSTTTGISGNNSFYDDALRSEISSLREANKKLRDKVADLEKKLQDQDVHRVLDLQVPFTSWSFPIGMKASKSLSRLDDQANSRNSNSNITTKAVAGRPTSPIPPPLMTKDIRPIEMTFKWTISDYGKKFREEKRSGNKETSCPFYLSHCGYKAKIEVYLNGNGTAKNRCISVFLRIIRGEYDRYLKWPVNLHLVVTLVNQSDNYADSLRASGNMFQYQQPLGTSDSECDSWGLVEFVRLDVIKTKQYIRDDKIVLKCRVTILT